MATAFTGSRFHPPGKGHTSFNNEGQLLWLQSGRQLVNAEAPGRQTALMIQTLTHLASDPEFARLIGHDAFVVLLKKLTRHLNQGIAQDAAGAKGADVSEAALEVAALVDLAHTENILANLHGLAKPSPASDQDTESAFVAAVNQRVWPAVNAYVARLKEMPDRRPEELTFYDRLATYRALAKAASLVQFWRRRYPPTAHAANEAPLSEQAQTLAADIRADHVRRLDDIFEDLALSVSGPLLGFVRTQENQSITVDPDHPQPGLEAIDAMHYQFLRTLQNQLPLKGDYLVGRSLPSMLSAVGHAGLDSDALQIYTELLLLWDFKCHLAKILGDWRQAGRYHLIVGSLIATPDGYKTYRALDGRVFAAVVHNIEENRAAQPDFSAMSPNVLATAGAWQYIANQIYFPSPDAPDLLPPALFQGVEDLFEAHSGEPREPPTIMPVLWSGRYLFALSRQLLQALYSYPDFRVRLRDPFYRAALTLLFEPPASLMHGVTPLARIGPSLAEIRNDVQRLEDRAVASLRWAESEQKREPAPVLEETRELNRLLNDWRRTEIEFGRTGALESFVQDFEKRGPRALHGFRTIQGSGADGKHALLGSVGGRSVVATPAGADFAKISNLLFREDNYLFVDLLSGSVLDSSKLLAQGAAAPRLLVPVMDPSRPAADTRGDLFELMTDIVQTGSRNAAAAFAQQLNVAARARGRLERNLPAAPADSAELERVTARIAEVQEMDADAIFSRFGPSKSLLLACLILLARKMLDVHVPEDQDPLNRWFADPSESTIIWRAYSSAFRSMKRGVLPLEIATARSAPQAKRQARKPKAGTPVEQATAAMPGENLLSVLNITANGDLVFAYGRPIPSEAAQISYFISLTVKDPADPDAPENKEWMVPSPHSAAPLTGTIEFLRDVPRSAVSLRVDMGNRALNVLRLQDSPDEALLPVVYEPPKTYSEWVTNAPFGVPYTRPQLLEVTFFKDHDTYERDRPRPAVGGNAFVSRSFEELIGKALEQDDFKGVGMVLRDYFSKGTRLNYSHLERAFAELARAFAAHRRRAQAIRALDQAA